MSKLFKLIKENTFLWFQKTDFEVSPKKEIKYEDVDKSPGICTDCEKLIGNLNSHKYCHLCFFESEFEHT